VTATGLAISRRSKSASELATGEYALQSPTITGMWPQSLTLMGCGIVAERTTGSQASRHIPTIYGKLVQSVG